MRLALFGVELEENLGLRSIHATAKAAGHDAQLFTFRESTELPQLVSTLLAWKPDVVGLSMIFTRSARDYVGFARELRKVGFVGHLTAGGHFASLNADALLADCAALDTILHGEGEEAILDLLAHLGDLEAVQGLSRRLPDGRVITTPPRAAVEDLEVRPRSTRPDEFDRYLGLPVANMLGSRGCFAACTFCSIAAWSEASGLPRVRMRTPEAVADEMADLYHQRGVRLFNFHDDNFFLRSKPETLARLRALRRRLEQREVGRIGLQVKSRPDTIDPDIVTELELLGVYRVFLGVESNSVKGLKALGRGIKGDQNHVALQLLLERGFHVSFNLLAWEPDCTLADLRDNLAFVERYPQVPLNIVRTEIYGGTPLEAKLRAQGRLEGDLYGYDYRAADPAAQQAWELFHTVFHSRNFTGEGANLRAMAVDCLHRVLVQFWPTRSSHALKEEVRGFISDVNLSNAALWKRILDFAEQGKGEAEAQAFGAELRAVLQAADAELLVRANALLARFAELADAPGGDPGTPGLRRGRIDGYLGCAKTALVVGLLGTLGLVAFVTLFGDNIRALFGMSTELAGDTNVVRRRPSPRPDGGEDGGSAGY